MNKKLRIKKYVSLLICMGCIFIMFQCNKGDFFEDRLETDPIGAIGSDASPSIAFISRITDNSPDWSLCGIDTLENVIRKIVNKTVACQKPVLSHSGTRLLFTATEFKYYNDENNTFHGSSQYELYIADIDGTALVTLIDHIKHNEDGGIGSVAWSPDDSQIVYVRSYDNYWDKSCLILHNISDKTQTILQTEGNVCTPKFSPNGKQIAYCTTVENKSGITYIHYMNDHHIYKMDADGKNNQLIIKNASSPQWSPQGDKIMFISKGKDGSSQISVANADGSNQKQLTSSVDPGWWDTGFPRDGNSDPHWTPDGKKIVYVSHENEKPEIFIMNVDGSEKTRLTKAEFSDSSPEITPDGKQILFNSWQSDMMNWGIFVMKIDGNDRRMLFKEGSYPVACK